MKSFLNFKRIGFFHKKKLSKSERKGRIQEFVAKLSKGIMLPISMLPIAGIFLGVGSTIGANANGNNAVVLFGNFLSAPGQAVFSSLALLFAIAIAIAFTNDSGPAGLAAFVAFLVFSAIQSALSIEVTTTNPNGSHTTIGYNLLFYLPHSLGNASPSAFNYVALTTTINGAGVFNDDGVNFFNIIRVLTNLNHSNTITLPNSITNGLLAFNSSSQINNNSAHLYLTPSLIDQLKWTLTIVHQNMNAINNASDAHNNLMILLNNKVSNNALLSSVLTSHITTLVNKSEVSAGLQAALFSDVVGINQLISSVFGGIIVGAVVALLYRKFYKIKLPLVLGFFSGVRFIPIISFLVFFPLTIVFLILWPLVGTLLFFVGQGLGSTLGFNSFIFGVIDRWLLPFGLHHAFYSPLWFTSAGGSVDFTQNAIIYRNNMPYALSASNTHFTSVISWQQLIINLNSNNATEFTAGGTNNPNSVGGDVLTFIQLNKTLLGKPVYLFPIKISGDTINALNNGLPINNTPTHLNWSDLTASINSVNFKGANGFVGVNIGQYLAGSYVFMITGLPAAAIAMIYAAPKENRKVAASVLVSAGLTSLITGITEPIEFTFLFLAPWLYWGIHSFLVGIAFGLMNWIGLAMIAAGKPDLAPHIGLTFSGGLLDWIIYGGIQSGFGSNAWWSFVFAVPYAFIYFFLFKWLVIKFNIATPGREKNVNKLYTKADYLAKTLNKNLNLNKDQLLALNVIGAYGGFENIKNIDACITKLRVEVAKKDLVNRDLLMSLGAKGTIDPSPSSLYAVFGVEADIIKNNMKSLTQDIENNSTLKEQYNKAIVSIQSDLNQNPKTKELQNETIDDKLASEKLVVYSPIDGTIVEQQQIEDETFKNNLVGLGVAIKPTANDFVAPIDGKLSLVFNTKHAYTFESVKGSQIMVHIGIDSIKVVNEQNETIDPFDAKVATNDKILKGSLFASVDLDKLKYAKAMTTPVVILNESIANREVKILKTSGFVKKGEPLFEIIPKKTN